MLSHCRSRYESVDLMTLYKSVFLMCRHCAVNRLKTDHSVEIHIPSDSDTTAVRIEGSREGVASAKAELLDLVDKMVGDIAVVATVKVTSNRKRSRNIVDELMSSCSYVSITSMAFPAKSTLL